MRLRKEEIEKRNHHMIIQQKHIENETEERQHNSSNGQEMKRKKIEDNGLLNRNEKE